MIRFISLLLIVMSVNSCKSTTSGSSAQLADAAQEKKTVQGYDFSGFKTMDAAPKGMICTAVLRAEEEACHDAQGKTIWGDKCKVICSKPIAPKGKVAGYNFDKFVVTDALPEDMACAAILMPEQEACAENGGQSQFAAKCKSICSVPIAKSGKLAGFNFDGPQINIAPLQKGFACTAVLRPEEEACRKAGGKVSMADKCQVICSVMINR